MGCTTSSPASDPANPRDPEDPFSLPKEDAALDPRFRAEVQREAETKKKEKVNKIPPPATGFMSKEQGLGLGPFKKFQIRFFVLKLGLLEYFDRETYPGSEEGDISTKKGEVLLTGMTLTEAFEGGRKLLVLTPNVEGERVWKLEVNDNDAREKWAEALNKHIKYASRCCCGDGGAGNGEDKSNDNGGGGGGGGGGRREKNPEFHNMVANAKDKKMKEEKEKEKKSKGFMSFM